MPTCRIVRGVYLISLNQEEIGQGDCEDIEDCLAEAVNVLPAGVTTILFDMEGVRFLRSSGLGALLSLCERLKPGGVSVAVCRVPSFGRNLFKISHLDEHLSVFATVEEAMASLAPPSPPA